MGNYPLDSLLVVTLTALANWCSRRCGTVLDGSNIHPVEESTKIKYDCDCPDQRPDIRWEFVFVSQVPSGEGTPTLKLARERPITTDSRSIETTPPYGDQYVAIPVGPSTTGSGNGVGTAPAESATMSSTSNQIANSASNLSFAQGSSVTAPSEPQEPYLVQHWGIAPSGLPSPSSSPILTPVSIPGIVPNSPHSTHFPAVMGASFRSSPPRGEFPPLYYPLPPAFWEPRQPQPGPAPPMHTRQAPSLGDLAGRPAGRGENFANATLKAIIIKAQPHHNDQSLAHLTRAQLVKHVDDLIAWWRRANPQQATQIQQASATRPQEMQQQQQVQQLAPSRFPLSLRAQGSVASAAASAEALEKAIGQCSCCCDAQQNAAFAPCGHFWACTRCAHKLYDQGRGKCPVCRSPIQTYLKIVQEENVIRQCSCCCDAQQNAAFAPCGHLWACTRCAHKLYDQGRGKCPVCRTPIQTYLKIVQEVPDESDKYLLEMFLQTNGQEG